jgi:uncharacterized protein
LVKRFTPFRDILIVAGRCPTIRLDDATVHRLVVWEGVDAWRREVAAVELTPDGVTATGTQVGVDPLPYRADYRLDAGHGFVTARLDVVAQGTGWRRELELVHDGRGNWTCRAAACGEAGLPAPGGDAEPLRGALDCDLGFSPLTNVMPIRRSRIDRRGEAEDFLMAWVSLPDLGVHASAQRYEHVRPGVVRYVDRGTFDGFRAELELDADGLVECYPGLANRVP